MNKRILDFHYQSPRLFGRFIDTIDSEKNVIGIYDIIFVHREIEHEGEIEKIIKHCKKTTKIIVDITTESGQVEEFLNKFKKILKKYDYEFILLSDVPIKEKLNCKVFDDYSLAFTSHLNDSLHGRVFYHIDYVPLKHGICSWNGSLRLQRLWLNWFFINKFRKLELPVHAEFNHYVNSNEGPKFDEEIFQTELKNLPKDVREELLFGRLFIKSTPDTIIDIEEFNDLKYLSSTINVVSENTIGNDLNSYDDKHHITFTEKTIKPLVKGQIPLIHSYFGLQNELRKLGFDLYDDFVNHSYEKELDSLKRLEMIVDESKRLLYLDTEKYLEENKHRVYNNKKLCEELIWEGKKIVCSVIENIILK